MPSFFQKNKRVILAVVLIGLIAAPLALVPVDKVNAFNPNPDPGESPTTQGGGMFNQPQTQGGGMFNQPQTQGGSMFNQPTTAPPSDPGDVCKLMNPAKWGFCVLDAWNYLVNAITMNILGWILGLVASVMDFAIKLSLDTSYLKDNSAISNGWKLIRDLVNMGFIFILLYIAISTILQQSSYNIKSMLSKLIIAAVFINFSLFITKVVMDAGNIVAQNFYNSFAISIPGQAQPQPSISAVFKGYLKMQDKYDPTSGEKVTLGSINKIFDTSMRFLTMLVAIYVFFRVLLLFLARILAFIFIMIFSPIGFIGAVFPGASGVAAKWRKLLIDQTLVAPVFIILIYLAAKMIESDVFQNIGKPTSLLKFVDPEVATRVDAGFYFKYIIVIGFLWIAYTTTKKLSGEAGAMVEKFGKKAFAVAAGATLAAVTGGAALAGRAVIGRAAAGMAASETGVGGALKGMAASKRTGVLGAAERFVGQKGLRATGRVAESSFDVRTGKLFQKGAGALGLAGGAETLGFTLKKKSALAEAKKEEQKKKETVGGYERQRGEKVKSQQEEARKTAAMLLPDTQKIERDAGLPAAKASVVEMEERAKQVRAANITPEAKNANALETQIRTEETGKANAEKDLAKEKDLEQKAKGELAQAQKDKAAAVASRDLFAQSTADAKIQATNAEITRSQGVQTTFNAAVQGHTRNITTLTQNLKTADEDILKAVSGGAAQLANLQKAVTDTQAEADRQIKAANDRIESFAKGITEDRPTHNVVRGAGGVAKGAAIGAAVGSVVPIVGTAVGTGVGATIGTIGAVRGRMKAEESQAVADYIRTLHNAQGGSRLKIKPGGGKKAKTLLEHIADISGSDLADTLKDLSSEDQEKLKKALGI